MREGKRENDAEGLLACPPFFEFVCHLYRYFLSFQRRSPRIAPRLSSYGLSLSICLVCYPPGHRMPLIIHHITQTLLKKRSTRPKTLFPE